METRVTAQNAMDHWKKKINEENEKLTKAEAAASDVEAEFEVRLDVSYVLTKLSYIHSVTELDEKSGRILRPYRKSSQSRRHPAKPRCSQEGIG